MRLLALLLLIACAPTVPYAITRPVEPPRASLGWNFADDVTGSVLTVENPTTSAQQCHVECDPTSFSPLYATPYVDVCLPAGGEYRQLIELMRVDMWRSDVCGVRSYRVKTCD